MTRNINESNIPNELKAIPQWIAWRYERRPGVDKLSKVPYNPITGKRAKAGQPATWTNFQVAATAEGYDGIGFQLNDDGIVGIDIDHCINPGTGTVAEEALLLVGSLNSYTEISPGGTGLHIFAYGDIPVDGCNSRKHGIEFYKAKRYLTVTGNRYGEYTTVESRGAEIIRVYNEIFRKGVDTEMVTTEDNNLIGLARKARNGTLFCKLFDAGDWQGAGYRSQSEADCALCNILAFWTGGDAEQMDRIFRASRLMRGKWDRRQSGSTYGALTIEDAIRRTKGAAFYRPPTVEEAFGPGSFEGFVGSVGFVGQPQSSETETFEPFEPFAPPDKNKLPQFPIDALPPVVGDYVRAVAENLQVCIDMPAVAALSVVALCVQGKIIVNPKPGWVEPLSLYAVIAAPPSDRKSPTIVAMTRCVYEYSHDINASRRDSIETYQMRRNVLKKTITSMIDGASKIAKSNPTVDINDIIHKRQELTELEHEEVKPLRLLADDVTPEALISLLAENNGRMAVVSSEGGLFGIAAGRYTQSVNLDVFLKAYSGDPIMVDRKGRESEEILHPALTLMLSVQPGLLQDVMNNDEFQNRGFLARFLYSLPVSIVGKRRYTTGMIPPEAEENYKNLLCGLLSIPGGELARAIHFSEEAHKGAEELFNWLEPKIPDEFEQIEHWAGKMHGQVMRIAGILHCIKWCGQAAAVPLDGETMQEAIEIGMYFLEHAKAAFQLMGLTDTRADKDARYILKRLDDSGETEISKRDLHRLCQDKVGFEKVSGLADGLDVLVNRGYIRIVKGNRQNLQNLQNPRRGGRPTERIILNPEYIGWKRLHRRNTQKSV